MVSTSFSSQDWSVLEEKAPTSVVEKGSQFEAMEGPPGQLTQDLALDKTPPWGELPRKDSQQQQPQAECETVVGTDPSKGDCPRGLTVAHIAEVKDDPLRPGRAGDVEVCVQTHPCGSQRPPGISPPQDKFLRVDSEAPRGVESSPLCPDTNPLLMHKDVPQHVPRHQEVTPSAVGCVHLSEESVPHLGKVVGDVPQARPRCRALGQIPLRAESEMGRLPPHANFNAVRPYAPSTAVCSCSVPVHIPCSLAPAAPNGVVSGMDSRGATVECTKCDPVTAAESGLGTEARQFSDVSVQTYTCESRLWHCCSAPSKKAQPLTKSVSLDTGFPGLYSVGICPAVPAHCCVCYHHHLHCHPERQSPSSVPSAYRHCSCSHKHQEAQFTRRLEVLQDMTARELYSVSIHLCKNTKADVATTSRACSAFLSSKCQLWRHTFPFQIMSNICRVLYCLQCILANFFSFDTSNHLVKGGRQILLLTPILQRNIEQYIHM